MTFKKNLTFSKFVLAIALAFVLLWPFKAKPAWAQATIGTGEQKVDTSGGWVSSTEVTEVGKAAARSREVLNWALSIEDAGFKRDANGQLPIESLWKWVRNIAVLFFFGILVVIAFGLIFRADWADRSKRYLPTLAISLILAYFSFAIGLGIIQISDRVQQYFFTIHHQGDSAYRGKSNAEKHLRAEELLSVTFNYQQFAGFIKKTDPTTGADLSESIKNTLWLVRLTTYTNYAIALLLLLRIIMLWGLMIFSPFLFPFLVFPLTRRVAIVWGRTFFYFLLLGPLFALFLTAIPFIWQKTNVKTSDIYTGEPAEKSGIPIDVNTTILGGSAAGSATKNNVYQSGTNILLTPPGNSGLGLQTAPQLLGVGSSQNNLSETDTYSRYLVALLMMWGAIILPFLLLRIIMGITVEAGTNIQNIWKKSSASQYLASWEKRITPPPPPAPKPGPIVFKEKEITVPGPAREVSEIRERTTALRERISEKISVPALLSVAGLKQTVPEVVSLVTAKPAERNLKNIAQLEQTPERLAASQQIFDKIAHPEKIADKAEAEKYRAIKDSLFAKEVMGEKEARSVTNALSQNISHYLVTDTFKEIQQNNLQQLSQHIQNTTVTNRNLVQNFQKVYNTKTTNLSQLLTERAATDNNARLALQALDKVKEMAQIAAMPMAQITGRELKRGFEVAAKLRNPEKIAEPVERQQFSALKQVMQQGAASGDENLAGMQNSVQNLVQSAETQQAGQATPEFSQEYLDKISSTDKDFIDSQKLWEKYYNQAPVPVSKEVRTRDEWLQKEAQNLQSVVDDLLSQDPERREKALKETQQILPFLLMGDYQVSDIAKYLMAKLKGVKAALKARGEKAKEKEGELVEVPVKKKAEAEVTKTMALEEDQSKPSAPTPPK